MPLSRTEPGEWRIVEDLYQSLRRFAAVVAPTDLEPDDLLQEALVSVLRKHSLSNLDHPAAYLRKAILNEAYSHSRRRGRWRTALAAYAASTTGSNPPGYPSDLDELSRLPPRERAALYLHEVEGYRFSEIGPMIGCSEGAARKASSRGRKHLSQALGAEVTL